MSCKEKIPINCHCRDNLKASQVQVFAPGRPWQRSWAWHSTLLLRECYHLSDSVPWLSAIMVFAVWNHPKDLHKPWPWACLPACRHYLIILWDCSLRKCAFLPSKAFSTDRDGALVDWCKAGCRELSPSCPGLYGEKLLNVALCLCRNPDLHSLFSASKCSSHSSLFKSGQVLLHAMTITSSMFLN